MHATGVNVNAVSFGSIPDLPIGSGRLFCEPCAPGQIYRVHVGCQYREKKFYSELIFHNSSYFRLPEKWWGQSMFGIGKSKRQDGWKIPDGNQNGPKNLRWLPLNIFKQMLSSLEPSLPFLKLLFLFTAWMKSLNKTEQMMPAVRFFSLSPQKKLFVLLPHDYNIVSHWCT